MSELEKLVIALASAIFVFIFSDNIGRLIYGPNIVVSKSGYNIKVQDLNGSSNILQINALPQVLDMNAIMATADTINGENIFKKVCGVCHTNGVDGINKVGPNLWGIYDEPAGHKSDFKYSEAMLTRKASGVLWNEEELYRYLYAPKQYVVGTKMAFAGIKDDKERADLIAFLKTQK